MTALELAIQSETAILERLDISEQFRHLTETLAKPIQQPGLRRWMNAQEAALRTEIDRRVA